MQWSPFLCHICCHICRSRKFELCSHWRRSAGVVNNSSDSQTKGPFMNNPAALACTICGERKRDEHGWFLISEDHWQDKLTLLHWDDRLATQCDMHCACSPDHLQQLVIHWMTTGSIEHPFAIAHSETRMDRRPSDWRFWPSEKKGPKPIGELSVHRESMQRVLQENPQSLRSILDALLSALHKEGQLPPARSEWKGSLLRSVTP